MNALIKIIKYTVISVVVGSGLGIGTAYAAVAFPQLDIQVVAGRTGSVLRPNATNPTSLSIQASVFSVIIAPGNTLGIPNEPFNLFSRCDGTSACNGAGSLQVGASGSVLSATFNNLVIAPPLFGSSSFSADLTYVRGTMAGSLPKSGRIEGLLRPNPQDVIAKIGPIRAALGDRVWEDLNNNGLQDCTDTNGNNILGDAGDSGPECLAAGKDGVTVNLISDCGNSNTPAGSMVTSGGGFYLFNDLNPGSYCVEFVTPAGFNCTTPNAGPGGKDPADSDGVDQLDGTCRTEPTVLAPGELDRTWDLGLVVQLPPLAALGDRVWEDLNNNGIQDCTDTNGDGIIGNAIGNPVSDTGDECDAGIPNVDVYLGQPDNLGNCVRIGPMVVTGTDGLYFFPDLTPGNYCVEFGKPGPDFCTDGPFALGDPSFTTQNVNGDTVDSDVNSAGISDSVSLAAGTTNRSVDAGIVCPAKIGDRVWLDNGDGIQQCAEADGDGMIGGSGDIGAECTTGKSGVKVTLYDCGVDGVPGGGNDIEIGTRTTDADGFYMFGADGSNLPPGSYYVKFDKPTGFEFTLLDQNGELLDSDCRPDGTSTCVTVGSGGINLNRDCGLVEPQCNLLLDKQCRLEPEPVTSSGNCKGKLQQFTVVWDGPGSISNISITSGGGSGSHPSVTSASNGDSVTFFGPFSSNDVKIGFTGGTNHKSVFHVSCSDDDFNSSDDCNKTAGDGKNQSGYDNLWLLNGFVDADGQVLDCSPVSGGAFSQNCAFTKADLPNCDSAGKPTVLTLKYTGGGCAANSNTQDSSKTSCSGAVSGPVSVRAAGRSDFSSRVYTVLPSSGVGVNDTFDLSYNGSTFESNTYVELTGGGTQVNLFHTSCSQPLAVGDVFGGLEVVAINGQTGGRDVTYQYTVTNQGAAISGINLTDDKLGDIALGFALGNQPASMTFTKGPVLITGTTTNTATVTVGGQSCGTDMVTVTVQEPVIPPTPVSCSDIKDITALSMIWNGVSGVNILTEGGQQFTNVQKGDPISISTAGLGNDVDLTISGGVSGASQFHVSCSDADMNGSEDCGNNQGDGKKNKSSLINDWLLNGMTGQNGSFICP